MLFVRDKGQMCNNIYQYINVYAWARKHNRRSMSMRFAHKYKGFAICRMPYHNKAVYSLVKALGGVRLIPCINYDNKSMTIAQCEQRLLSSCNAIVEGWNVRYGSLLPEYMDEIRQLFAFDDGIKAAARRNMLPADDTTVNIGLHIRRGDYKSFMGGRHYFTDKDFMDYLALLLDNFKGKRCNIYLCTNDKHLDRDFFLRTIRSREEWNDCHIVFPHGSGHEDLCLLSECDFILGPVSSYSLIATMYGKARCLWMSHKRRTMLPMSLFRDFQSLTDIFDISFFSDEHL
ncbi:glycosyltransferase [Prevotella sp. PINT]|jgi:Glycosyl transferase family 11.|uniref:alpha-1,2-fucosyltransferase n=1 Tax=Palleniella intestinalis TaxID=2736291 RepID=UPI001553ACF0|nr:alpha-1,2-fucosyltransferase [Palleniella intestinalis]NPD82522.1 glycosyltransferase [Palleniella intestinalis]